MGLGGSFGLFFGEWLECFYGYGWHLAVLLLCFWGSDLNVLWVWMGLGGSFALFLGEWVECFYGYVKTCFFNNDFF
jgi:hypothetical protein